MFRIESVLRLVNCKFEVMTWRGTWERLLRSLSMIHEWNEALSPGQIAYFPDQGWLPGGWNTGWAQCSSLETCSTTRRFPLADWLVAFWPRGGKWGETVDVLESHGRPCVCLSRAATLIHLVFPHSTNYSCFRKKCLLLLLLLIIGQYEGNFRKYFISTSRLEILSPQKNSFVSGNFGGNTEYSSVATIA